MPQSLERFRWQHDRIEMQRTRIRYWTFPQMPWAVEIIQLNKISVVQFDDKVFEVRRQFLEFSAIETRFRGPAYP
jgi:hypothetical protein